MPKKLTAHQKAIKATQKDMKKNETVRVLVGRAYTNDDCDDLVAPIGKPEINLIKKSIKFLKATAGITSVKMEIRNPHTTTSLDEVMTPEQYEEYEDNNWGDLMVSQFALQYPKFDQSDETCRLTIFIDTQGEINLDLEIGSDSPDTAMSAIVFRGKTF